MPIVTIRVNDDLRERLDREVKRTGLRRSDVIRRVLEHGLPQDEEHLRRIFDSSSDLSELRLRCAGQPVGHERYERVKHLLGSLDSGVDDLGTDHERHLRETFAEDDDSASGHGPVSSDAGPEGSEP